MCPRFRFDRFPLLLALLLLGSGLGWPEPAEAVARWINVQPGSKEQLWLAGFPGFALGLALRLMVYELRARGISISLRRLTDLPASVDGRSAEETRRGSIKQELKRLSDEVLFSARRITQERREFDVRGKLDAMATALNN